MKRTNKKSLQYAVPVVGIIIAVLFFALTGYKTEAPQSNSNSSREVTSQDQAEEEPSQSPSTTEAVNKLAYQEYSEPALTATSGTRLIFFHAPWCPQCLELDKSIKSSQIPEGVTIFKADYDSEQQLRQKYGVTLQTTVVKLKENGSLDKKVVPYDNPVFETIKKELL